MAPGLRRTVVDAERSDCAPDLASAGLAAFIDGYEADDEIRRHLPDAIIERTTAMYELLRSSYENGTPPWAAGTPGVPL